MLLHNLFEVPKLVEILLKSIIKNVSLQVKNNCLLDKIRTSVPIF